jgi:predicted Zn-ribbon and HTH transcriptional regulator
MEKSENKLFQKTIRQEIIQRLAEQPMGARDLSQALGIREKLIYDHLDHVSRSMMAQKKKLHILPIHCLECGYIFKERRRFTPPGRCPRCKSTRLEKPRYQIF